jgi:2-phosphosulfolactate phosphatase
MDVQIAAPGRLGAIDGKIIVIIDVFRASNTIIALLSAKALRVYLLADVETAFAMKADKPGAYLLGERQGVTIHGMEGGNSPAWALRQKLNGREIILTTSAGTQALAQLRSAAGVFYGSFANAAALSNYLRSQDQAVTLLPMGLEAKEAAQEDDLAACYLQQNLWGQKPDFNKNFLPELLHGPGAERLRRLGQNHDLKLCTQLDTTALLPIVDYSGRYPAAQDLARVIATPRMPA